MLRIVVHHAVRGVLHTVAMRSLTHTERAARGFTLIESVATLTIISVVMVGLVSLAGKALNQRQIEITTDGMNELRRAMTGNPVIVANESRTSFGYLGDMGTMPANLQDLWFKSNQPGFTFDTTKKTGAGWQGPYLEVRATQYATALGFDAWGNAFYYTAVPAVDSTFGANVIAKLVSLGPALTLGDSQNIGIDFFQSEAQSRVQGYVKDSNGNGVGGVNVTVNYPQAGVLTSGTALSDGQGYYAVSNIPFGNRSITINPQLVLAPNTTSVSGNNNQNLNFTVNNFSATNVAIASVTVTYTVTPTVYFGGLTLGNTTVFSSNTARLGTGSAVTVSPAQTVTGTGSVTESIPVRIQSPVTDVADLTIGTIGKGGSLAVSISDFESAPNSGSTVDITGVTFEVVFKDANGNTIGDVSVTP